MRRPRATKAQRSHARVMRAQRRLLAAAVRYSLATDPLAREGEHLRDDVDAHAFAFAELVAASDAIRNSLSSRELRKLAKRGR